MFITNERIKDTAAFFGVLLFCCFILALYIDNKPIKPVETNIVYYVPIVHKNTYDCSLDKECLMLAKLIYAEARGEGRKGMQAVAHVVLNRLHSKTFPSSIEAIISAPKQFSSFPLLSHMKEKKSRCKALYEASRALLGISKDNTDGSLFFVSTSLTSLPKWTYTKQHTVTIGKHIFFK